MSGDPYLKTASSYDKFTEPFNKGLRKLGFKLCPPRRGARVLEVGCGTGSNLKLYQRAGRRVCGIDLSPSMLKEACRKLGREADLRLEDASQTSCPDNHFDLVIAMLTLHEMSAPVRSGVMTEIGRVMKKSGRALLIDFHPGPLKFPKGWLSKMIIYFFEMAAGKKHFRNYRNFIIHGGLLPLIKKNNFTVEKKKVVGGGNFALYSLKLNEESPPKSSRQNFN